jgi:hypothetical protein
MAGNTWITDMNHFADVADPGVHPQARRLAGFLGRVVHEVSCQPRTEPRPTSLRCRRPRCPGRLHAWLEGLAAVQWFCDLCDEQGRISNWRGSAWDMTGRPSSERELPRPATPPPPVPPVQAGPNAYSARLHVPTPSLDAILAAKRLNVREAMIVALVERGGPMSGEELARRLDAAGVESGSGDMGLSIRKAWRGLAPIDKDPDGRYSLDLGWPDWSFTLWGLGLKEPPAPTPPVAMPEPAPGAPLTKEEVEAALGGSYAQHVGLARKIAAVLEAHGRRDMTVTEVQDYFARLTGSAHRIDVSDALRNDRARLLALADGRVRLSGDAGALSAMRAQARKLARPRLTERAQRERFATERADREQRQRAAEEEATTYRRCLLRVVPDAGDVQAAALLDLQDRSIRTYVGDRVAELGNALLGYDVLIGLYPHEALAALRVDPNRFRRLIDLRPPQKSRRINKRGRTLAITPELLITSSTGASRPLGDPAKTARYLVEGDHGKLERRLASDVKALFAFYRYGVLQRGVRLRWGFLDDGFHVAWELPGEPSLFETLRSAAEKGQSAELVVGNAPGWEEPWSRARRYQVCAVDSRDVIVVGPEGRVRIPRVEVQAARVLDAEG